MSDVTRDLKTPMWFTLSLNASADLRKLEVKTPALGQSVSTFKANCERALQAAKFPEAMFAAGRNFQIAESLAFQEATGHFLPEDKPGPMISPEIATRRDEILVGKCDPWIRFLMNAVEYHEHVTRMAQKFDMMPIIEDAMANQITSIWTTIEALFGDLWEAAVNAHPKKLAALSGPSTPGNRKQTREKDLPKQIPLWLLDEKEYKLEKMGTILRDLDHVTFTKLDRVREAYSRSFDEKEINDALAADGIRAISAVRNLIVHKAGVCDGDYEEDESELFGKVPRVKRGDRLQLDGLWMTELIRPPLKCCINLIQRVDDWLGKN